jgi:hypothetical protein
MLPIAPPNSDRIAPMIATVVVSDRRAGAATEADAATGACQDLFRSLFGFPSPGQFLTLK